MGEIMNSKKGVESGVPERVSISCPTCGTRHDVRKTTGNQSCVTVGEQTVQHNYVTQKCQICEQGLYDDHTISEKYSEFETSIDPLNRKSSYLEQTRAARINC